MVFSRKAELVLLLCSSIVLITLVSFWLSQGLNLLELSSRPLFSFSALNAIIFTIILLSARDHELLGENIPLVVLFVSGDNDEDEDGDYISSDSEEDHGYHHGLDGYDEDDDDDYGSDEEYDFGWEEEEEEDYDPELQRRIECFIEKVVEGWRREWFEEMCGNKSITYDSDDYPP